MTEVGIECDFVSFQCQFKKVHTRDCKENIFSFNILQAIIMVKLAIDQNWIFFVSYFRKSGLSAT